MHPTFYSPKKFFTLSSPHLFVAVSIFLPYPTSKRFNHVHWVNRHRTSFCWISAPARFYPKIHRKALTRLYGKQNLLQLLSVLLTTRIVYSPLLGASNISSKQTRRDNANARARVARTPSSIMICYAITLLSDKAFASVLSLHWQIGSSSAFPTSSSKLAVRHDHRHGIRALQTHKYTPCSLNITNDAIRFYVRFIDC